MIRQLSSDLESFKSLTFGPGLNIILADKSEGASDLQSRNGAGKTSLVELVHFLFGAETRPDSIFRSDALKDRTFNASVDIGSKTYSVSRSGKKPSRVYVEGDIEDWPVDSHQELFSAPNELPNEQWKNALGALWFGLPANGGGELFQPSFRSLFSFVARRQEGGGFQQPMKHSTMQQPWDQQATICYLIGLDWTIPGRFQELRDQEKVAKQLRKAAGSGELGRYFGKPAELRTQLTLAEAHVDRLRARLDSFRILPEYKELEREASEITGEINNLNVENIVDQELLGELQSSLTAEDAPDFQDLNKLYARSRHRATGLAAPPDQGSRAVSPDDH